MDAVDTCPRCAGRFRCGANDPQPCPCGRIRLTPGQLAALRERYAGCLCLECLAEISEEPAAGAC